MSRRGRRPPERPDPDDPSGPPGPLGLEVTLFLALVRAEPDWRDVTVDVADARPGGHAAADERAPGGGPCRLTGVNRFAGVEVGLPAAMVQAFPIDEAPPGRSRPSLAWLRRVRAGRAQEHLSTSRHRAAGRADREVVDWGRELAVRRREEPVDDDVVGATGLLQTLLATLPGPWSLLRLVRSGRGGLLAFGLDASGDLVLASRDVEARRAGEPAHVLWLPGPGPDALGAFLDLGAEVGGLPPW